ncbi:MAG TPA: cytochrome C, partial [Rhodothermia bacterium]|nr:cytochrome C [Rhodothermia bacterium]
FGYDEQNTPRETRMLIKTGGGSPTFARASGIHWHMNIANEITYIATDRQRQQIPWVRLRNRQTGKQVVYTASESPLTPQQIASMPRRVMDCVDCHNRPTHVFLPPDHAVDNQILIGAVDASLPYIKREAVNALTKPYDTTAEALSGIKSHIDSLYRMSYKAVYGEKKSTIDRAIASVQRVYQSNFFPEMKVDWKTHPDNIGHLYFPGCFRCHDNQHVSADGKTLSNACDVCHTVLSQREGSALMVSMPDEGFTHPVDLGDLTMFKCSDCHSGAVME